MVVSPKAFVASRRSEEQTHVLFIGGSGGGRDQELRFLSQFLISVISLRKH